MDSNINIKIKEYEKIVNDSKTMIPHYDLNGDFYLSIGRFIQDIEPYKKELIQELYNYFGDQLDINKIMIHSFNITLRILNQFLNEDDLKLLLSINKPIRLYAFNEGWEVEYILNG